MASRRFHILILLALLVRPAATGGNWLQERINAAGSGDTLFVPAGIYTGNIVIDKRILLVGKDRPVIHGSGTGSTITVTADSCSVIGLVVEHCGSMLVDEDAGILMKSNHNRIEHNELRDVLFGIYLLHAEHNIVSGNTIAGRKNLELGERGSGIHVWNSQHNDFLGNIIHDARDGFYIQNASHTLIERNEVYDLRYGLHYMYADSNTFLRNMFYNNVAGAAIMYSTGIRMFHNVFSHNRGFSSFGILFQDCHRLIADSNVISDNVVGMFFEASTDNLFRRNVIAQNDIALQMFQNSINNTFTGNDFIGNLSPLVIVGKRTDSHWSEDSLGNYWSSYDGYDIDGDGIGDVPMKIQNVFQYLEGVNSNARLYLYSPAAQAIGLAARAFPILTVNEEIDPHPLMRPVDVKAMPAAQMALMLGHNAHPGSEKSSSPWIALPLIGTALLGFLYRRLSRRERE